MNEKKKKTEMSAVYILTADAQKRQYVTCNL